MTPKVPWALHRRCEEHYDLTESPWVLCYDVTKIPWELRLDRHCEEHYDLTESPWVLCYDVTKIPWELRLDVRVLMKKALQPKSL